MNPSDCTIAPAPPQPAASVGCGTAPLTKSGNRSKKLGTTAIKAIRPSAGPLWTTDTHEATCMSLIKRVTEIMFFAYGLTETWKSEPRRLTIPHNSQLCWGLFVSNHLQKNMSFWIISYEQRIMQGIWMLESWSQVAIMKCSRYQFCNLRRTSLPTLLSFDHSCQEKPWFLNQHLAQRILKRWRLQSVIWCHVLVPPADVFWCPSQGRHINTSKQAAEWMNPYRCQQK